MDADEVQKRLEKAVIRRYAMGPKVDFHQPESTLQCTGLLDSCICDKCSEIKEKIPRKKPLVSKAIYVTPTRGAIDTVMCYPAPYIARKRRFK